jgi:hypothetical protein
MAEVSETGHGVQCPLCEGLGHFRRAELICRLSDPHFLENVGRWRKALLEEGHPCEEEPVCVATETFETKVRSWPGHEILWRRSPKE